MKIALIDPSLFTIPYDQALAGALTEAGHQVELFGRPLRCGESWDVPGVILHPLFYRTSGRLDRLPRLIFLVLKGLDHIAGMERLVRGLAGMQPDIIHFQWCPLPIVDRWFLPRLRKLAPVIMTVHDTRPFNESPSASAQKVGARTIFGSFDRLIVHTAAGATRLAEAGVVAGKISQIPHGLLDTPVEAPQSREAETSGPDDPVLFVLIGNIKRYKGVDILIRAAQQLPEGLRGKCRFLVAGKPHMDIEPLYALAKQCGVQEQFDFRFRFLTEEEFAQTLSRADALVFPYREIDASGILFKSLSIGRPIIASAIGVFAELLEDRVHGRLIPPEDPAALAAALADIAADPEKRRAMGDNVRALMATIPGWSDIARRTEALYDQALHERSRGRS